MTPASVACFMASLFPPSSLQTCCLLDGGAGMGALSCVFLHRWVTGGVRRSDSLRGGQSLRGHLAQHLTRYSYATSRIIAGDYIRLATAHDLQNQGYTPM